MGNQKQKQNGANGRANEMGKDERQVKRMNKKPYNRRNSNKNQRRTKEAIDSELHVTQSNPYSWYSHFPQFTKDAGNLSFGFPLGQNLNVLNPKAPIYASGVYALRFYPTIGYSADMNSPINRSAVRFYTYLRDVQKAAAKYDSADVMMYLMAMDSCYMFWAHMRRIYGVSQLFTPVNKYYPQKLLALLGVDASITNNLAEFRQYINRFALSLGSYTVPAGFDITDRHMWMCEGMYLDSNTTRAQTYLFVPEGFWEYDNTVTTGSQLNFIDWAGTNSKPTYHTLQQIMEIGDRLISAIRNDQDTGNISGDLYSAAAKSGNFKLRAVAETPELFSVIPVYDEVVLSQIENATICGKFFEGWSPVITQNPSVNNGAILFQPQFELSNYVLSSIDTYYGNPNFARVGTFVNMHVDSPSPEAVIEATRFTVSSTRLLKMVKAQGTTGLQPDIFGADIISRVSIGQFANNTQMSILNASTNALVTTQTISTMTSRLQLCAINTQFDWSPMLYIGEIDAEDGSFKQTYFGCDVDNITPITPNQLGMMHEASMLSLFDIPQMGLI